MRHCLILTASMMGLSLVAAAAQGSDPFEITVKAFTPVGAPVGERTATCSPAQPCRLSWPIESNDQFKTVVLVVKEVQPGHLQAIAMHGLNSRLARFPNKPDASASLSAVRSSRTAGDVVLMKFQVTRR